MNDTLGTARGAVMRRIAVLFACWTLLVPIGQEAMGQDAPIALDAQLLQEVYHSESRAFQVTMQAADWSAFPVFYAAPAAAWGGAWLIRDTNDFTDAYRLTVTAAATYGAVIGLKEWIERPRPYRVMPGIEARNPEFQPRGPQYDSFALPSGHAALSFALVTSWSLSHPKWYVIAPGATWATSVALSRVWLGVHYPSDIVAGALLGTAIGVGVHLLAPLITPGFLEDGAGSSTAPPMLQLRIQL